MTTPSVQVLETVTLERDGHVLVIGLNRPEKRNSFNLAMLADLSRAYGMLESDDTLRAGVLFGHGDHFTAGLDLIDVGPAITSGTLPYPEDGRDPWRLDGTWTKPIVAARLVHDAGIELLLAADIRIAAAGTRFAQTEVQRGIYPFGGATLRFPRETGWGNAMRWLLSGDEFDATEAHASAWSKRSPPMARPRCRGPERSPAPSPSRRPRWVSRPCWRPPTLPATKAMQPRLSGCGPTSPSCSAPPTRPRECGPS
jgi:enoyl-CoA hydratase/carnithine racemase